MDEIQIKKCAKVIYKLGSQGVDENAVKQGVLNQGYSEDDYYAGLQYLFDHQDEIKNEAEGVVLNIDTPEVQKYELKSNAESELRVENEPKADMMQTEANAEINEEKVVQIEPEKEELEEDKHEAHFISSSNLKYTKTGTTFPAVQINLNEGQKIYCEAGAMSWMTKNIKMDTKSKGFWKIFSRLLVRESLFVNEFESMGGEGIIAFTPRLPGNILPIDLHKDVKNIIAQKDSLLCAENGVETSLSIQASIFRGLFGGEGFIMQKFTGEGAVFLEIDGSVVERNLGEGEEIYVDQGNIAAFEDSVQYHLTCVKGVLNWFFSSEGMFIAKLTGPGKVWLQTMPANQLSRRLRKMMFKRGGRGRKK